MDTIHYLGVSPAAPGVAGTISRHPQEQYDDIELHMG